MPKAVLRQLPQLAIGESESIARQLIFAGESAAEHSRIIRIEHHRNARVVDAAQRMIRQAGHGAGGYIA